MAACKSLPKAQEPVISIHSMELAGASYTGVQLLCKVNVENHNAFDIPFPEISWKSFINNESFISGKFHENQLIQANQGAIIEIPVNLDYLELFDTIDSLKGSAQADYKIAMDVSFNISGFKSKVWKLEPAGVIPVLQAPVIGTSIMRVEKLHRNMVEWYVSVNIENPNVFELPQPKHTFVYQIYEKSFIRRTIQHRQTLASASVTPVIFGLLVYYNDVYRVFPDLITSKEIPSQLDMVFDFLIPAFNEDIFKLIIPATLPLAP
jgi:LEA14-like dessication related protein